MHASEEAQGSNYWLDFWLDQRLAGVTYVPVAKAAPLYVFVAPAATYAFVAPAATYVPVAFVAPQHMCSSPPAATSARGPATPYVFVAVAPAAPPYVFVAPYSGRS